MEMQPPKQPITCGYTPRLLYAVNSKLADITRLVKRASAEERPPRKCFGCGTRHVLRTKATRCMLQTLRTSHNPWLVKLLRNPSLANTHTHTINIFDPMFPDTSPKYGPSGLEVSCDIAAPHHDDSMCKSQMWTTHAHKRGKVRGTF